MPSSRAACRERSTIRPSTFGPRSLTRQRTVLPVLMSSTTRTVPKGRLRWAQVKSLGRYRSPLAVRRPDRRLLYTDARPTPRPLSSSASGGGSTSSGGGSTTTTNGGVALGVVVGAVGAVGPVGVGVGVGVGDDTEAHAPRPATRAQTARHRAKRADTDPRCHTAFEHVTGVNRPQPPTPSPWARALCIRVGVGVGRYGEGAPDVDTLADALTPNQRATRRLNTSPA